jgi:hypothetical protein
LNLKKFLSCCIELATTVAASVVVGKRNTSDSKKDNIIAFQGHATHTLLKPDFGQLQYFQYDDTAM